MYIYRCLNSYDNVFNPLTYGLYAKNIIYDFTKIMWNSIFERIFLERNSTWEYLKDEEYRKFRLEGISIDGQISIDALKAEFYKTYNEILDDDEFLSLIFRPTDEYLRMLENKRNPEISYTNEDSRQIRKLMIESNIAAHTQKGSKYNYGWIAFSKYIVPRYYANQAIHQVVVIESKIEESPYNENTYDVLGESKIPAIDQSDNEALRHHKYYVTQQGEQISDESRTAKFAEKDCQVIYYSHVPNERIVAILNALQVDLMCQKALDYKEFYKDTIDEQKRSYEELLKACEECIQELDELDKDIFDKLYKKNLSTWKYCEEYENGSIEEIKAAREKILKEIVKKVDYKYLKPNVSIDANLLYDDSKKIFDD